ncbi:restriction endonuclease subunit S [Bifidobacterium mongoliense]|uniref:restriction endonuclease subunit S n=1 Tax=Bifidobacterium mongoliense TaxID=518643 RepID=UPI0030EE8B1C
MILGIQRSVSIDQAGLRDVTAPFFSHAWEQRKVGELLTERNKQEPASDDYPLMAFIANEGVAPKGDRYDRSALVSDSKNKKYKKTELGDFIYSSNNLETGSIGLNRYGRASISPVYSIFHPTNVADSNFLGRRLVRRDFINAMVRWRQGVVYGQWRIHESDFIKIQLSVPVIEEQRAIGTFLDTFDDLITLHQRKLSHLRELKRGLLQKMFPKSGEDRPEVRFPGFADAWEQRKLSDISDVTKLAGFEFTKYVRYQKTGKIIALRGLNVKNGKLVLDDVKYIDDSDFSITPGFLRSFEVVGT